MNNTNIGVEVAIANLNAAKDDISNMFGLDAHMSNIFDVSDQCWSYAGGVLTIGIEPDDCEFAYDVAEELAVQFVSNPVGDYCLVYATEDTYNARVNRRWNNMAYYIVNKQKEI